MAPSASSSLTRVRQQPVASASSTAPGAVDPRIIWVAFRRSWFWVIPLGLIFAVPAGYVVYKGFVPEYEATHILEANQDYVVFKGVFSAPDDLHLTERHLLTNALVLDPVLADPEVCKAPSLRDPQTRKKNLRDRLSISNTRSKQLLMVNYRDLDPEYAAIVCNAIVDSYLRQRQAFDSKRVSDLEGWLQPAIGRWENEVKGHQERVRELSQQTRGFDPFKAVTRVESELTTMTGLFAQLTKVKGDEEVLRVQLEAETSGANMLSTEIALSPDDVERFVAADAEVIRLRRRQEEKLAQMRRLEDGDLVRINREWYKDLAKEVAALASELKTAEASAEERAGDYLRSRAHQQGLADRSQQIADMQAKLATLVTQRQWLESQFQQEKSRLEQFAGETVDLYFAQQQYAQAASILEQLNLRIASLRTERQRGATIQTLAKATPPAAALQDLPLKKIVVTAGGAFVFPFVLALLWELIVKRISTPAAIESRKLMPVIGEVARLPVGAFAGGKKRIFEESVDALRASLLLSSETGEIRSIAVASSMSGEGKSSLASQLAVSIAKATGETVLLVDADLRSPDQHHLFGLEMGAGLVGVLSGRVTLSAAVDRSLGELVHVLPAGYLDASPHRLLSPSALRELLDHAINELGYRYVLFDTAPVLSAGETLAVAAEADVTLLCVMRDVSRVDHVERTAKRLETTGASLGGIVFNGVPSREYAYRYGDYRYGDQQRQSRSAVANVS